MKTIIFDDGGDEITISLTISAKYIRIHDGCDEILIHVQGIDELIESLHKVKKELNLD